MRKISKSIIGRSGSTSLFVRQKEQQQEVLPDMLAETTGNKKINPV